MRASRLSAGGGLPAVAYVLRKGREAGGVLKLYRRLRSRNACKTCAVGMGGQHGGMVNEAGHFPEVCKKSVQAQAGDMAAPIGEDFFRRTPIAALGRLGSAEVERLGRLAFPILAEDGDTHFRRVTWAEALDRAGAAFRAARPEEVFFYSSGRSSNEAAFLLQLVARVYGTANIHNCSFYCHQASGVALSAVYGSGTASITLDDLAEADLAVVAGANPASNHPRLISQLVQLRRRGGKVVIVNPLRELGLVRFRVPSDWRSMLFGSTVSDLYLQPHAGGDVALFKALLKGVVETGGIDRAFIAAHTTGWEAVAADIAAADWDELVRHAGVSRDEIARTVDVLLAARRGVFLWAMGLTHHAHGVDNVLALANLALSRGWLGRPGCGLLPVRGHSNVQGVGTCGVTPALKDAFAAKLEALYGIPIRPGVGHDTYASMEAAADGRVQACVLLGGNLFASNPDRAWSAAALRRIGLSFSLTTKLNEGHVHGRGRTAIVVPVLARDEESQPTTQESMFNFVRMSDGGTPAVAGEMRSEVDVIAALAELILPPGRFDWSRLRSHRHLREAMAKVVPGMAALARIDETRGEFHIAGRAFREPRFATPDGKARFHVTPLPDAGDSDFRLTTIRSEGQFNTVVYEEEDVYRGTRRRDVVLMAAPDAARLGIAEGDRVVIETGAGQLEVTAVIGAIRPGNLAMYYPEANALVPRRLDPRSHTPAFKSVAARLRRAAVAAALAVALLVATGARAHDSPIDPSACAFEPLELSAAGAPAVSVAPAGPSDVFRIVYDVAASDAQFDLRTVPPRAVTIGTESGSVAFSSAFRARLWASGDLLADVGVTLDRGGSAATTTLRLTTGLAAGAGAVLEGAPIAADGRFTLVGVDAAGLSNLGTSPLLVRLGCQAQPAPDLDQFQPAARLLRVVGRIRDGQLTARTRLSPPALQPADFALPAAVRASNGGATIASAGFLTGLAPAGRAFVATADDGIAMLRVRTVTKRPVRYAVDVVLTGATVPAGVGPIEVTVDVGGLVARATRRVRPNRGGTRARIAG